MAPPLPKKKIEQKQKSNAGCWKQKKIITWIKILNMINWIKYNKNLQVAELINWMKLKEMGKWVNAVWNCEIAAAGAAYGATAGSRQRGPIRWRVPAKVGQSERPALIPLPTGKGQWAAGYYRKRRGLSLPTEGADYVILSALPCRKLNWVTFLQLICIQPRIANCFNQFGPEFLVILPNLA